MQTIVEAIAAVWLPERIAEWLANEAEGYVEECLGDEEPCLPEAVAQISDLLDKYPTPLTDDAYAEVFSLLPQSTIDNLRDEIHDIAVGVRENPPSLRHNGLNERMFL